jgi:hypothetical protein
VVVAPGHASAAAERVFDRRAVGEAGSSEFERAGQRQAVRGGECQRLLGSHRVLARRGVVGDIPAGCLTGEPLPDVPLGGTGVGGQFRGCERTGLGQGPVQPEPVTEDHVAGRDRRAEVGDEAAEQLVQLLLIDGAWRVDLFDSHAGEPAPTALRER